MSPIQYVLMILNAALAGLAVVQPQDAALAEAFVKVIQTGMTAYQSITGQPIDLTKIPTETKVP